MGRRRTYGGGERAAGRRTHVGECVSTAAAQPRRHTLGEHGRLNPSVRTNHRYGRVVYI